MKYRYVLEETMVPSRYVLHVYGKQFDPQFIIDRFRDIIDEFSGNHEPPFHQYNNYNDDYVINHLTFTVNCKTLLYVIQELENSEDVKLHT